MAKLKYIKVTNFTKPKRNTKTHNKVCLHQATNQLAKDIQDYLFAKGFSSGGTRHYSHLDARYIYINFQYKILTYSNSNARPWEAAEINFAELKRILD